MRAFLSILLCLVILGACAPTRAAEAPRTPAAPVATAPSEAILVLAASDLQFALTELANQYQATTGRQVTVSFGATGNIATQIENGAPADVFFAADERFLANLEEKGLLGDHTRDLYATGRLVITSASSAAFEPKTLQDLTRPELRAIAIANPETAPYGFAAKQALQASGVWDQIEPKVVFGENIAGTFQLVQTGNADAGIVALSVALGVPGTPYTLVDQSLYAPLRQAVAVIKRTKHPVEAQTFINYVNGHEGRPIMKKYGFALPGE